jgi:hypothetical protein
MQAYMPRLLSAVEEGKIDPSFVISHRLKLSPRRPTAYDNFNTEKNQWRKVSRERLAPIKKSVTVKPAFARLTTASKMLGGTSGGV